MDYRTGDKYPPITLPTTSGSPCGPIRRIDLTASGPNTRGSSYPARAPSVTFLSRIIKKWLNYMATFPLAMDFQTSKTSSTENGFGKWRWAYGWHTPRMCVSARFRPHPTEHPRNEPGLPPFFSFPDESKMDSMSPRVHMCFEGVMSLWSRVFFWVQKET